MTFYWSDKLERLTNEQLIMLALQALLETLNGRVDDSTISGAHDVHMEISRRLSEAETAPNEAGV